MAFRALAISSFTASRVRGAAFLTKPFTLAKTCSIGFRSGEYLGRNSSRAPDGFDGLAHGLAFVRSQIVENDDIVGLEGGGEELLDIGQKALAVDGAVEHAGRLDAIVAQRGQKGRCFPMAMGDFGDQPMSARSPAVKAGHVGFGPGLVDEDQSRRIDLLLTPLPADAMALYVRTILLLRDERLFLSVTPIRRKNRLIIEVSAVTPRSASSRSHSA